jgi:predicted aminopeptidase
VRLIQAAVAIIAACVCSSCYVTSQGWSQARLLLSREPIDEVIASDKTDAKRRAKLLFVKDVLAYASAQGLRVESSYQSVVSLDREAVTYTVHAARPFEMRSKTWWFPIVGDAPYLGYFDRRERDAEAKKLEEAGLDVYRGGAAAFSSLGWFSDPLYSPMLNREDAHLADLLFHELTHRTVWISGDAEFNENLAEFVAGVMTKDFLISRNQKADWDQYQLDQEDLVKLKAWVKTLRSNLETVYTESQHLSDEERSRLKAEAISLAISKKPKFSRYDFVGSADWNNARILAMGLYQPDETRFAAAFDCFVRGHGTATPGNFLKSLEKQAEKAGNGFAALDSFCQNHNHEP